MCMALQGALPVNTIVSKLRPDIVIVNNNKKSVYLVELNVSFEQVELNVSFQHIISKVHERKTHKYADLVLKISQNGYNCNLTCIEIGSRGLVTPETNNRFLRFLHQSQTTKVALKRAKPPKSF